MSPFERSILTSMARFLADGPDSINRSIDRFDDCLAQLKSAKAIKIGQEMRKFNLQNETVYMFYVWACNEIGQEPIEIN